MCPEMVTRTYQIADACGNVATCTQKIIIQDTIPPEFIQMNMAGLSGGTAGKLATKNLPLEEVCSFDEVPVLNNYEDFVQSGGDVTDNCGVDTSTFTLITELDLSDGVCPDTLIRTYQIADFCGNTATCTQLIVVNDTLPPIIACPITPDSSCTMMTSTYETLDEFIGAGGQVMDNCGIDSSSYTVVSQTVTTDCPQLVTTVYSISDSCGNTSTCTTSMMITDDVPPMISCPGDTLVTCDDLVPVAYATLDEFIAAGGVVSDDCTLDSMSFSFVGETTDGLTCPTTITRTYSIADLCGNTASCTQIITVDDTIPPTAVCMDITIMFMDDMVVEIEPEDLDGGSFDNCGDVTVTISDSLFNCEDFTPGNMNMTVVVTVTDECGNSSFAATSSAIIAYTCDDQPRIIV